MTDTGLPSSSSKAASPASPLSETVTNLLFFVGQRLLFGLLVLLAVIFLTYFGLDMARGNSLDTAVTTAFPRTLTYLGRLAQGDLGQSTAVTSNLLPVAITDVLPGILAKSLGLLGLSLLLATLVGVTLGTLAARQRTNQSLTILLASIIGISMPSFFTALLLQLLVIRWTQWAGKTVLPLGGFGWDDHLLLPMLVLAARPIAQITRITYISIQEVQRQDFVRTAQSKGLSASQVLWRHIFRNAAVPILTTVGLSSRFSLSSLPVVEFFFSWPGLGFLLLKAISRQDDNLTIALLLSTGILFILVNLLLETAYRFIDPRLRDIPEHITTGERQTLKESWQAWKTTIRGWAASRANSRAIGQTLQTTLAALLPRRAKAAAADKEPAPRTGRSWRQGIAGNIPLLVGGLFVIGLIILFAFGPSLAPHSPYTTRGLEIIDGEFFVPPFAPDEVYPWGTDVLGRDMMSLILAGTQQTLILVILAVLARVIVGVILGALAGWFNGGWLDRLILATAEIVAAFPTLLLTMILILAFGIRNGLRPFLIAFCVVGWGEIMQFIRSEVATIRPQAFIESAVAVGSRTSRILLHHVLPNVMAALISLATLEIGAVLMLLGELGFIGIFIGGGAFAELEIGAALYHYADVPEWGALLSNVRPYARAYPWTAIYPTLAFFIAILTFNLFGEGIRRLVAVVGVQFTRLFNRYTLILALIAVVTIGWIQDNTGAVTFYRRQAAQFSGEQSLQHVAALAAPGLNGRSLDTPGSRQAAEYIAQQFAAAGLQAAGEDFTYFQPRPRDYQVLTAVPQFTIADGQGPLTYRQDFTEFTGRFFNMGEAQGPIRVLTLGDITQTRGGFGRQLSLIDQLDFSNEIVMALTPQDALLLGRAPRLGTLVIAPDDLTLSRRFTLSSLEPAIQLFGTGRAIGARIPEFWISQETANRLLQNTEYTTAELRRQAEELEQDEFFDLPTAVTAYMHVTGTVKTRQEVVHVVGHLPGLSEVGLNSQVIIVMAQYDGPPPAPDGTPFPGANDNASGVAVMLEAIRTMQESGYQPSKTFLFVAYSGEGQEGGSPILPIDPTRFLEAKYGFSRAFTIEAVVEIRGVGAGTGDELAIAAGGSLRLAALMAQAAGQMGVRARRTGEPVDLSIVFEDRASFQGGQEAPLVGLHWSGWEATARTPQDTVDTIAADHLEKAGRVLSLALMIIGRETQY